MLKGTMISTAETQPYTFRERFYRNTTFALDVINYKCRVLYIGIPWVFWASIHWHEFHDEKRIRGAGIGWLGRDRFYMAGVDGNYRAGEV